MFAGSESRTIRRPIRPPRGRGACPGPGQLASDGARADMAQSSAVNVDALSRSSAVGVAFALLEASWGRTQSETVANLLLSLNPTSHGGLTGHRL